MSYTIADAVAQQATLSFFLACLLLLVIFSVLCWVANQIEPRKSLKYRKYLADMYVSGKIRQYAGEDKLDLDLEDEKFVKFIARKEKQRLRDLDNVVESNLNERIEEAVQNKLDEKSTQNK